MCDIADEAFEREEWERTLALKNRQLPDPPSPVCRNGDCGEPSQPGASYCCPECRKDDELHQWAAKQRRVA
ncbi:hypothetical protein Q3V30_12975 [Erwinia pyri]|uniref:Uncharacterized protein n=1 Tax=Erwinia pyri TaxID=3062598 RepID=A0AA50DI63_9GAMM|nr:hypothetical protein [Erwinia sp. DE2]WLS77398.1 hypothetical protein Q3V30_12975 [Erwinia sp. DE2]